MCLIYAGFKMIEPEDSIRAGTSLGPPPFIQGREALNPQTAHAMVLAAKPRSRLCHDGHAVACSGPLGELCGAVRKAGRSAGLPPG